MLSRNELTFEVKNDFCTVKIKKEYEIIAQFLMYWNNPVGIVQYLIPLIDLGIIYGHEKYWRTINNFSGYYIEERQMFLEGISADVVGLAFVRSEITIISDSSLSLKELRLESNEFRKIVVDWLSFIIENRSLSKFAEF